jgi:argininosuccinate lyase
METVEQAAVIDSPSEAFYRPKFAKREPLFNAEQQKAFDKAFAKRERKLREEYGRMREDLLDTVAVTAQLLEICRDRVSVEDESSIRDGLVEIKREYQEKRAWQKPQR